MNPAAEAPGIPPPRFLELILAPRNWRDNPLAVREARREVRRRQPHLSYLWTLLVLSTITLVVMWGLFLLLKRGFGIPWLLGGNPGTALCMALCGVHAWFILAAAQKHSVRFIQQEANANTLSSLLMLPIRPFKMLLRAAVYPWLAAMRLALIGLPFYAFCVALGLPLTELILLYVIFAVQAVAIPAWGRPILSEKTAFIPAGQQQPVQSGMFAQTATQQNAGPQAGGAGASAMMLPMMATFIIIGFGPGRGNFRQALTVLRDYAPDSIIQLLPLSFVSWPLLMARALITPFDWFGIPMPPILFLAASFLIGRYLTTMKSAEFLQVGAYRDLPALPTYERRLRWEGALRIGRMFVAAGYLWKWGIVKGGLSFLTSYTGPVGAPGLAGFAFLIMVAGGLRLVFRGANLGHWMSARPVPPERGFVLKLGKGDPLRYLVPPLAFALSFYLACALLARAPLLDPVIAAMIVEMALVAWGGCALAFAARRVGGGAATALSAIGLLLIPLIMVGPPQAARFSVLSPALGLVRFGRPASLLQVPGVHERKEQVRGLITYATSPPPWWHWPIACSGAGLLILPLSRLRLRRRVESEPQAIPIVTLNPTRCGYEVYNDWMVEQTRGAKGETTPAVAWLVETIQRVRDNPITAREIRARLRGRFSARDFRTIAVLLMGVTILMLAAPAIPVQLAGSLARMALPGAPIAPASAMICFLYVMILISLFAGFGVVTSAFGPEREKSTLGFVLLTPMTATQIVMGKLFAQVFSAGLAVWLLAAWTLLLSIVLLGASSAVLGFWAKLVISAVMLMLAFGGIGLGIAALFPRRIAAGCAVIMMIVGFQGTITATVMAVQLIASGHLAAFIGEWNGTVVWLASIGIGAVLAAIGLLSAIWGVRRMRKGDIGFESSKQAA